MKTAFDDRAPSPQARGWRHFWRQSAAAWGIGEGRIVLLSILPIVVVAAGAASAVLGKSMAAWVTGADDIFEWSLAVLYFCALASSLAVIARAGAAGRLVQVLYVCVGLGLVLLLGEELRWGERLLGWITPGSWLVVHGQVEPNSHSKVSSVDGLQWVQLAVCAYGLFMPLLFLDAHRRPRACARQPWVVPPVALIPYFAAPFIWQVGCNVLASSLHFAAPIAEFGPMVDLLFALGLVLGLWFQLRAIRHDPTPVHIAARVASVSGGSARA